MNLTFKEKGLWLMLASLLLVYGYYFTTVLPPSSMNINVANINLFISVLVALVAILIIGYTIIAATSEQHQTDERDSMILLKGSSYKSYVLSSGIIASIAAILLFDGNFWVAHCLLLTLVLAEVVDISIQLIQYRRWA